MDRFVSRLPFGKTKIRIQQPKGNPIKKGRELELRQLSTEDGQMANKHRKRCATSLVLREMQMKTTVSYYFIHYVGYYFLFRKWKWAMLARPWRNRTVTHRCGEVKGQLLWKSSAAPPKLNMELPHDPAIPLLGRYPKELKMGIQAKT